MGTARAKDAACANGNVRHHGGVIRVAKVLLVAALMVSIGAHWAVIQGAAWVRMAVEYTVESGSVVDALEMTFDGMHPCSMCKVVQEGTQDQQKKQEDSQKQDTSLQKLNAEVVAAIFISPPKAVRSPYLVLKQRAITRAQESFTPPPRTNLA
ncbi:MAG: hypothetical protein KDK97_09800 [Verrucomicrobiales bacterium]|nr:hypothetical protein [Verrucomicrobiales bacterium]MCP5559701.1 hypothetical protein [Verrucomicrobiaceae bacterium]